MVNQLVTDWSTLIPFVIMLLTVLSFLHARKERKAADAALEEARQIANSVVKISFMLADGSSRWGGIPAEHMNKIKQYKSELQRSLESNIETVINQDVREVNEAINARKK